MNFAQQYILLFVLLQCVSSFSIIFVIIMSMLVYFYTRRNIATRRETIIVTAAIVPCYTVDLPIEPGLPRSVHLDLNLAESDLASISVADPSPHSRCSQPVLLGLAPSLWHGLPYLLHVSGPASFSSRVLPRRFHSSPNE